MSASAGRSERTNAILQALWALDQTDDLSLLLGRLSMQDKTVKEKP